MLNKPRQDQAKPPAPKAESIELIPDEQAASAEDRSFENSATRPIQPAAEGEKYDHLAHREALAEDRQEALLDEALEETFPGSDPISPKHIT